MGLTTGDFPPVDPETFVQTPRIDCARMATARRAARLAEAE